MVPSLGAGCGEASRLTGAGAGGLVCPLEAVIGKGAPAGGAIGRGATASICGNWSGAGGVEAAGVLGWIAGGMLLG
ncbi:hypothetical protein DESC_720319 [Desulfosarcina cetonica]|nr:hypothetical protein DESC_720319 [Desulfosarcina cetonica]